MRYFLNKSLIITKKLNFSKQKFVQRLLFQPLTHTLTPTHPLTHTHTHIHTHTHTHTHTDRQTGTHTHIEPGIMVIDEKSPHAPS